jgi:hypothetical protein
VRGPCGVPAGAHGWRRHWSSDTDVLSSFITSARVDETDGIQEVPADRREAEQLRLRAAPTIIGSGESAAFSAGENAPGGAPGDQ